MPCHETRRAATLAQAEGERHQGNFRLRACTNSCPAFIQDNNRLGDEVATDYRFSLSKHAPMRLKISHRTEYRYDAPVKYGLQRLRLMPQSGRRRRLLSWSL